jgi:glycosyltransferase involved in cell wall biosynthesis
MMENSDRRTRPDGGGDSLSAGLDRPFETTVSVLMPVMNEVDVIGEVVEEWTRDVFSRLPKGSELLMDDCSDDGTREVLLDLEKKYPFLKVNYAARDGFYKSAMRLYSAARGDLIFFTDSDGQYVASEFWRLAALASGAEMIHGWKLNRKDPAYRRVLSDIFNCVVRILFGSKCIDVNSAFRLVHRASLSQVISDVRHIKLLPNTELYLRLEMAGARIVNVPVQHRERAYGSSRGLPLAKLLKEGPRVFLCLLKLRFDRAAARPLWKRTADVVTQRRECDVSVGQ